VTLTSPRRVARSPSPVRVYIGEILKPGVPRPSTAAVAALMHGLCPARRGSVLAQTRLNTQEKTAVPSARRDVERLLVSRAARAAGSKGLVWRRAPAGDPAPRTTLDLKTSKPRTLPPRCDVRANARRAFARVAMWAAALTWCRLPAEWRRHGRALPDFLAVARRDQPPAPPPFPAHNSKHRRRRRFHPVRRGSQVGLPR
jgi:hypothetical protein